jgi:hypothetical protein
VQQTADKRIFNDTSVYFIQQIDALNPVLLSPKELELIEELFLKAVTEYNERNRRLIDSLYKKEKLHGRYARRIDVSRYLFALTPSIIEGEQKTVYLCGDCKDLFSTRKRRGTVSGNWKQGFIDGNLVLDGGSCFIYLFIKLGFRIHGPLRTNGEG